MYTLPDRGSISVPSHGMTKLTTFLETLDLIFVMEGNREIVWAVFLSSEKHCKAYVYFISEVIGISSFLVSGTFRQPKTFCVGFLISRFQDTSGAPYPVMMYFHGGGYTGSANIQYPGHFLAGHDVVVAVPNYRLGALGKNLLGKLSFYTPNQLK